MDKNNHLLKIILTLSLIALTIFFTFLAKTTVLKVIVIIFALLVFTLQNILFLYLKKHQVFRLGEEIVDCLEDALLITDRNNQIVYANNAFLTMVGYEFKEIKGKKPSMFRGGFYSKDFYKNMWHEINNSDYWKGELIDKRKDGSIFIKTVKIKAFYGRNQKVKYYYAIQKNIDYIKQLETDNERNLYLNSETLLPNEKFFLDKADRLLVEGSLIVLCQVMNRLLIETTIGTEKYHELMVKFYNDLNNFIKDAGILTEFGRSSLAILFNKQNANKKLLVNEIIRFSKNQQLDNLAITLDIRLGIVEYNKIEKLTIRELLSNASVALKEAIKSDDLLYVFYHQTMKEEVNKEFEIQTELKKAIEEKQLKIFYQPQINTKTNRVIGIEALIRWFSDKLGYVSPPVLLEIAEKYNYMSKIDDFIFATVMKDYEEIYQINQDVKISINISQQEFIGDYFFKRLSKLKDNNFLNNIVLELTESKAISNENSLAKSVNRAKELGIEVSLDDFGTGYNSLKTLSIIPVDEIKIDKSFIDDFPSETFSIVSSIMALASSLNKRVIAEGVETKIQEEALSKIGCYNIQGYLHAKPMPLYELKEYLKKEK